MSTRSIRLLALVAVPVLAVWLGNQLERTRFGEWMELRSYDLRFRLRGPLPPPTHPGILLVLVDEESLQRIPEPLVFWQGHFARTISTLVRCRAAAIGLDFVFGDTGRFDPDGQQALIEALLAAQSENIPTVLAYGARRGGADRLSVPLQMALGPAGFAFANLTTDPDDFVRRQEVSALDGEGRVHPGFASSLASALTGGPVARPGPEPSPPSRTVLINFRGRGGFPTLPFWKVLEEGASEDDSELCRAIAGNIVLVGMGTEEDLHATPLYYWPRVSAEGPSVSPLDWHRTLGIAIHAHALSTLLEGPPLVPASYWRQQALALSAALLVTGSSLFLSFPLALLGLAAVTTLQGFHVMQWSFSQGTVLQLVAPAAAVASAFILAQGLNYRLEGREKRKLRRLFQRYVSPEVIRQLVGRPERLALEGERRAVTVLFSDIRDFTTRCERTTPEELVLFLNRYLTAMVEIIHRHGGMVDKFIGDAIMAVFGAPLPLHDHARRAVEAGLEMQSALRRLNRKFASEGIPELTIGIGIHSGEAIVGNIGSPERMEYTVIGDTVNVSARIESLCKRFGPSVLISGSTRSGLNGRFLSEKVGEELLKGKTLPVAVYRVLGGHQSANVREMESEA